MRAVVLQKNLTCVWSCCKPEKLQHDRSKCSTTARTAARPHELQHDRTGVLDSRRACPLPYHPLGVAGNVLELGVSKIPDVSSHTRNTQRVVGEPCLSEPRGAFITEVALSNGADLEGKPAE
jgi:hypothetical protein